MKRILVVFGLVILGMTLLYGVFTACVSWLGIHSSIAMGDYSPPPQKLKPLPDVDVLAARMTKDQEVYRQVRDEALANYAKVHPEASPYDEEAKSALRLMAYLCVWDDYYGEGLRAQLDGHMDHLIHEGSGDTIWPVFCDIDACSGTDPDAEGVSRKMLDFGKTGYPALFKFAAARTGIVNLTSAQSEANDQSLALRASLTKQALAEYGKMIQAHFPNLLLFRLADDLFDDVQADESALVDISNGLDQSFASHDPANPLAAALDGDFYVNSAWSARGTGWANTVSQEGWQLMRARLAHANQILTDLYAKNPSEAEISVVMMNVVLGQEQSRDQMELWFQRGLQADPDNWRLRMQKRWYLLPRWYGSDEEVWKYGLECASSDNWAAKVPLILVESVTDAANRDGTIYAKPEIWTPVEKVFRAYLERYPQSSIYRSRFLQVAVAGGHWDVAQEQINILGDDWDRNTFEDQDYGKIVHLVAERGK